MGLPDIAYFFCKISLVKRKVVSIPINLLMKIYVLTREIMNNKIGGDYNSKDFNPRDVFYKSIKLKSKQFINEHKKRII